MLLNRTQAFELFVSVMIVLIGCCLAYYQYSSWMLAITGTALLALTLSKVLRQYAHRNQAGEAQHAN